MQVIRSVTDSGMPLGLCQTMALRRIHPSSCSENATRHGIPTRFLNPTGFRGRRFGWFGLPGVVVS